MTDVTETAPGLPLGEDGVEVLAVRYAMKHKTLTLIDLTYEDDEVEGPPLRREKGVRMLLMLLAPWCTYRSSTLKAKSRRETTWKRVRRRKKTRRRRCQVTGWIRTFFSGGISL